MDSLTRLLQQTAQCLARYESQVTERTMLAAVSGGVDSTVLALALARLQKDGRLPGDLHIAHIDHGVRPDSAANARSVVELAERLEVPVSVRRLALQDSRPSEDTLRQARYRALLEIAAELGAGLLVTGHHADDNIETVLFRMLRGTGPRGLAGIPEARWALGEDGPATGQRVLLVRPFLRQRRKTLEGILSRHGLQAWHDTSNDDLGFARNRLRHQTIPQLRNAMGAGLDVAMMTVARTARAATEILEAQGRRLLAECGRQPVPWRQELDLAGLDDAARPFVEEALRKVHRRLHPNGATPLQSWVTRVIELLDKPDGTRVQGRAGLLAERTREGLLLVDPGRAGLPPIELPGQELALDTPRQRFGATEWWLTAYQHPQPPLQPSPREAGRLRALLDPRRLPMPWRLRTRRPGDRFQPLGYDRPLDLRRFLQSRHLPRFDRDRLPLLVDGQGRILWVPGVEISHWARLHPDSRHCIELRAGRG